MMYNILINNLSLINVQKENTYKLGVNEVRDLPEDDKSFTGIYTNEPITHALIREYADENIEENKEEKLDLIYSIVTDKVLSDMDKPKDDYERKKNLVKKYSDIDWDLANNLTHYDLYQKMVLKITKEEYVLEDDHEEIIKDKTPDFDYVQIPNIPEAADIYAAVVEMANKIIKIYNEKDNQCRLYFDYTGGDRSTSTILIALTKMLEERGIQVDHIWAVNYGEGNPVNEIHEKIAVNYIFDFISGLQEFKNYGRANILNKFFDESSIQLSASATEVRDKISSLADVLQLCRSTYMGKSIGDLVNAVKGYINDAPENKTDLFDYLIGDIEHNYADLWSPGDRTILNIIKWCLDKNLIQQAITMYAELLPEVLVKEKIIWFSNVNWVAMLPEGEKNQPNQRYYSFINSYIWEVVGKEAGFKYDAKKKLKNYWIQAKEIANYIVLETQNEIKIKQGMSAVQLARILNNYKFFKTEVRNNVNHASNSDISVRVIRDNMYLDNSLSVFNDSGDKMTVQLLTNIMQDMIKQVEDIIKM